MTDAKVKIDLTEFSKTARQHIKKDWPAFVVSAFSEMAEMARDGARILTKQRFKLHSDYVIKGIKHYPQNASQKSMAAQALKKHGDMNASVYLRGARNAVKHAHARKESLQFMADHEFGAQRNAQNKYIAVPTKTLKSKNFRNNRGRVKKSFTPKHLLKRFNESGSTFDGNTTRSKSRVRKKRMPGSPFIVMGSSGRPFIVRQVRRSKKNSKGKLEFLYILNPSVNIKLKWGFVKVVYRVVKANYSKILGKHYKRLPGYRGK
jgi:hypothetical protein